jgi:uroporphyrin-III C-methyltransferase
MTNSHATSLPPVGRCYLVGAGPGDPELLTLKALRLIQSATLLLADDLVSADIVKLASASARVVHVGKRGGRESTSQEFIEKLMIMAARQGELVVRLKGGDPFIFGRGGEEVEHLRMAGIAVEVVNGITAGLAAATSLGVPLTHRDHAHGVVFITGHAKPGSAGHDWQLLAGTARMLGLTLVIYMGVATAARHPAAAAGRRTAGFYASGPGPERQPARTAADTDRSGADDAGAGMQRTGQSLRVRGGRGGRLAASSAAGLDGLLEQVQLRRAVGA